MTKAEQTIMDRIHTDYRYRPCPLGADRTKHNHRESVRSILGIVALELVRTCPGSRELNHALNKIDEALYWSHAAIDKHGKSSPETAA